MSDQSLFRKRFSCRRFTAASVEEDKLAFIIEAGRWAPSAGNLQPWRFVIVRDLAARKALAGAAFRQGFLASEAPVVIVVCAVPAESARVYGERGATLYCIQDTAAAAQSMLLAATEVGLGSCWVGSFDEGAVASALGLAEGIRPVAMIAIGHPAEAAPERTRRAARETVLFR